MASAKCPDCKHTFDTGSMASWVLMCPWCGVTEGRCADCHRSVHFPKCWAKYKKKRAAEREERAEWTF